VSDIVAAGGRCVAVAADLTAADGPASLVRGALERFGRVDIAVASAGIRLRALALTTDADRLDAVLATNTRAVIETARACAP